MHSHHFPHRCISCRCVRETKPSLADSWAWSTLCFSSPAYVSVNSTLKMETWESWFLTCRKVTGVGCTPWEYLSDPHPAPVHQVRGCVSKAASSQASAISFSYRLKHDLRSQLSSCCLLCYSLLGLGECSKNILSCPSKGPNILKLYAGKVFLSNSWTETNRQTLWRRTRMVSVPLREFMRNSAQF